MKLKSVSCTQFAGVRNRSVSFTDGINVVFGKNESGKSTLVNLIARTLFQNARIDGRSDKEFRELYFPSARKGSTLIGDYADGTVSFETEQGECTLTKEWGADSRCTLSTPDGVIRDQKTIQAVLKDVLQYGEGVYSDMLFSSQRNTDVSLKTILDASLKTDAKQEITNAVSRAFAESDGVSVDAIEEAIQEKIDEIAGKHWDFAKNAPVRKTGRWATGLGEILKAYYAMETAESVLSEISQMEADADRAAIDYTAKDAAARAAEEEYNRFNTFAARLAVRNERKKAADRIRKDLDKTMEILSVWPNLAVSLEKAKTLQAEKNDRDLLDRYEAAKAVTEQLSVLEKNIPHHLPSDDEIVKVKSARREINALENKLCGMNLTADIKMFGGNAVEIVSLRTGEVIDISDGKTPITEAVRITVPGVMEMNLAPADVDAASVEARIAEIKTMTEAILAKYGVDSPDELENLAKTAADTAAKMETASNRLSLILGTIAFSDLETAASEINAPVRSREEIEKDILDLSGSKDILRFITAKETIAESYASEYGSVNDLKAKAFDLQGELAKANETALEGEDIPQEYLSVSDPEGYLESLQVDLKTKQSQREAALNAKTSAVSRLEGYRETVTGDPAEDAERAKRAFEEQKALLAHWQHIAEVFRAQKEQLNDHPMQNIADRFAHYLSVISDGKVSSEFPEADKLSMTIYSDRRLLDYGKLSEGTKETVSLAFRLAVLDHLFPEGGGVIVFDDPFTDMDAERTAQSCRLIQDCANRHQIIFLTCKEEYLPLLGGNTIRL